MIMRFAVLTVSLLTVPVAAGAQSYTDVPTDSAVRPAVEHLRDRGFIQDAEMFHPERGLNRAEAAKVIVAAIVPAEELAKIQSSHFSDVPDDAWFMPPVEAARILGIVQTVEKFRPADPVTKAEFIKMTLAARDIDYTGNFSDVSGQMSRDVPLDAWHAPVMRYALASSMTSISQQGELNPNQPINRGQMALLTFRLEMYLRDLRIQALLSQAEVEIANVLQQLEAKQTQEAVYAANRSIISARGALAARPNEVIVKAAVKVSEGFGDLVEGYVSGTNGDLEETITHAKQAYANADRAQEFSSSLSPLTDQMRQIASKMANEARELQAQQVAQ